MDGIIEEGRIFILAEVAQAYEGSAGVLLSICERACKADVDGVMFQVVLADELATPAYTHYNLFKSLEMPENAWRQVIECIHQNGKLAVGEVFGCDTASMLAFLGIDLIKLHASDLNNRELLSRVAGFHLPVLLSVGGSFESEIDDAISILQKGGASKIILMHGYQSCPTAISDSHINKIMALKRRFRLPVGYSDHIAGCEQGNFRKINNLANYLPLLAIGSGADLIEKHIILDRSKAWEDYESALDTSEFLFFVKLIREFEGVLGKDNLNCNKAEEVYRLAARKCLVAGKNLKKGTLLTEQNIALKRIPDPENGIVDMKNMIGKKLKVDLMKDGTINQNVVS